MRLIARHVDHDPNLICRPAGNGLCEPFMVVVPQPDDEASEEDESTANIPNRQKDT